MHNLYYATNIYTDKEFSLLYNIDKQKIYYYQTIKKILTKNYNKIQYGRRS